AHEIVRLLGLPTEQLLPAFEDPLLSLATEVSRPLGAPSDTDEGNGSGEGVDAQVDEPTGWVLPLVTGESWTSPAWRFRRGRLVLTPGDSPMGLRLPLDAISWSDPEITGDPAYLES